MSLPLSPQEEPRNCCLCGDYEVRQFSHRGKPISEMPPVCSPCRAERTGAIQLSLPREVDPAVLRARVSPDKLRFPSEDERARAIQVVLRMWRDALVKSAEAVTQLVAALEGGPAEERVAHELLGTPLVGGLEALTRPPGTLKLTGLAPALARRLATEVRWAEGPPLLVADLPALEAELAEQKAQPTAPPQNPADGSHGDAP